MSRNYFKLSKPRHAQGIMVFNRRSIVRIQDEGQDDITELPEIDFDKSNEPAKATASTPTPEIKEVLEAQSTSADYLAFDAIGTTRRFPKDHELDHNLPIKEHNENEKTVDAEKGPEDEVERALLEEDSPYPEVPISAPPLKTQTLIKPPGPSRRPSLQRPLSPLLHNPLLDHRPHTNHPGRRNKLSLLPPQPKYSNNHLRHPTNRLPSRPLLGYHIPRQRLSTL
jgi:hypothetical protein